MIVACVTVTHRFNSPEKDFTASFALGGGVI